MKIFITGASGFVGSHVIPELISHGHTVVGLARSEASAAKLTALGPSVTVVLGSLTDIDVLTKAASESDGVIHLGFIHDFSKMDENCRIDAAAIQAMGNVLDGKPLIITSGTAGLIPNAEGVNTEDSARPPPMMQPGNRGYSEKVLFELKGPRTASIRLCPSTHGPKDHGFMAMIVAAAKKNGVSAYVGDGSSKWSSGHVDDAARLYRLAVEGAPAGSILHAVGDEGITIKEIAEVIGKKLNLEVRSISAEEAPAHFGFLAMFVTLNLSATAKKTEALLGWKPVECGLIEDLEHGDYLA